MGTEVSWILKIVNPRTVIRALIIVRNVHLVKFSIWCKCLCISCKKKKKKIIAKYTYISNCLVCEQAKDLNFSLLVVPDNFKVRNQTVAGFEWPSWWVMINKNVDWINYICSNQWKFTNYTMSAIKGIAEQLDATSRMAWENRFS